MYIYVALLSKYVMYISKTFTACMQMQCIPIINHNS